MPGPQPSGSAFPVRHEAYSLEPFSGRESIVNLLYLLERLEGDVSLSLRLFAPEGLVCVTMLLLLLSRMFLPSRRRLPYSLAFLGVLAALAAQIIFIGARNLMASAPAP